MTVTVVLLDLCRLSGHLTSLPAYTFRSGLAFLPASLCFGLHATLSLSALHGMNIPMYGAIKRCTPLVSLVLSVVILRKQHPSR
jgi:solute carrier family 35 protein